MKVYLASWYASRPEIYKRAQELRREGVEVTSRWLEEVEKPDAQVGNLNESFLQETARVDIEDIILANMLVLNVPSQEDFEKYPIALSTWARGGRHFEAGFQYALMLFFDFLPARVRSFGQRSMIIIGKPENVFHYLNDHISRDESGGWVHHESNTFGSILTYLPPRIHVFETWDLAKQYIIESDRYGDLEQLQKANEESSTNNLEP